MITDKTYIDRLKFAAKVIDRSLSYKSYVREIPNIFFGLVYKNKLIFSKGYGFIDKEKKIKVSNKSCFRIASISKTFTAISILQLVEKGKLNLDDRVSRYLRWFKSDKDKSVTKITIRQLLTHTSGITRDGDTPHWVTFDFPTIDQIKKYISTFKLSYEPNEKWKYSNLGYAILGEVIKVISKKSYEDYVQENIFIPLGMSLTSSDLNNKIKSYLLTGYGLRLPNKKRETFPPIKTKAMAPATGFTSNALDLSKFISSQFKGNVKLLSEESKRELRRIQWLRDDDNLNQAIGFQMWNMNGKKIFSHTGGFQGYKTGIAFDFERQIGVIVLINVIDVFTLNYLMLAFHTINYVLSHSGEFIDTKAKKINLAQYEGTFMNIWGATESMVINKRLILFEPISERPLKGFYKTNYIGNHSFLIVEGDSFGNIGQEIKFQLNDKGEIKRLYEGATPSEIFTF